MTPEQALELIVSILKQVRLNWAEQDRVREATLIIKEAIKPGKKNDKA